MGLAQRSTPRVDRTAEMKYVDQIHYCDVQVPPGTMDANKLVQLRENFHRRHEQLYTYSEPDNEPEIVSLRASIAIETHTPTNTGSKTATPDITIEPQGTREVIMPDTREFRTTPRLSKHRIRDR